MRGVKCDHELVRRLRASGMRCKDIAARLQIHIGTVWAVCNPEKAAALQKKHKALYLTDPAYVARCRAATRKTMRKKYGIKNPTDETRGGPCEICGKHQDVLRLDHDHSTGEMRGWLCTNCNRGLGYLKDSTEVLMKALAYLERSKQLPEAAE